MELKIMKIVKIAEIEPKRAGDHNLTENSDFPGNFTVNLAKKIWTIYFQQLPHF
jgi:hypothetical protein